MKRLPFLIVVVVTVGPMASLCAAPSGGSTLQVMVPMRDGTRLATDVYLPSDGKGPWPVTLIRTPYNKNRYNREYGSLTKKGYAVVIQDMRGRFASEGTDLAFYDGGWGELQDGVDTLDWIAAQPWCNGKIGTQGASAMGITQNMLAGAGPKHLTAQYILVAAGSLYHHGAYTGGALRLSLAAGWLTMNRFDPANIWDTLLHPMYDEYWRNVDGVAKAGCANAPAVHFGGWYDCFLDGTLDTFVARQTRGGKGARGTQKLLIGPWCHGGPGTSMRPKHTGDVLFPENARELPQSMGGDEWFAHYLKGEDTGVDRAKPVMYYTMGALDEPDAPGNAWRLEETWPPPSAPMRWYLQADGGLQRDPPTSAQGARDFVDDPRDPVPTLGGGNLVIPAGIFDQRPIESRPDVLVFTSPVLTEPIEVTGPVAAHLFFSSSAPDTDIAVKLCDVYPDGRSYNLCDSLLRMRHRYGFDRVDLMEPGQIVTADVHASSTSIVFNRGHRIRVLISSSNYPRFDANPNTGWPAWPFAPVQTAHNTVYAAADQASYVTLPVVTRDDDGQPIVP